MHDVDPGTHVSVPGEARQEEPNRYCCPFSALPPSQWSKGGQTGRLQGPKGQIYLFDQEVELVGKLGFMWTSVHFLPSFCPLAATSPGSDLDAYVALDMVAPEELKLKQLGEESPKVNWSQFVP